LTISQLLLDPVSQPAAASRELYQRAAAAIEQRDLPRASQLLERLVEEHAESELAPLAAYHLAEVLWLQQRPEPALRMLAGWSSRFDQTASRASSPASDLRSDAQRLLLTLLPQLPDSPRTLSLLEELATESWIAPPIQGPSKSTSTPSKELATEPAITSSSPATPLAASSTASFLHADLCAELSRRHRRAHQYSQSQHWLQSAIAAEERSEWTSELQFELPLAWAEHELSSGDALRAIGLLEQIDLAKLTADQQVAVRFLLAESLFAAGKHAAANEQFDWLTQQASGQSPQPAWLAAIALRRGELLVRARDYAAAQQWLQHAKREHTDFVRAYEFDYLLARCAVAQINFDEAQRWLQQVIDAPAAQGTEAAPRAAWMMGEVFFLQRDYSQAISAYRRVAEMTAFPQWQARALLQSAKCYEHLGQAQRALEDYRLAQQLSQQDEVQQQAAQRVAAIESLAPALR